MREILFRGKRTDNGEWVYGFYVKSQDYYTQDISNAILSANGNHYGFGEYTFETYNEIDESTLGQYTGLKDNKGTKIFEGDILQLCDGTYPCLIYWSGIGWALKRNGKRVDYAFGCDLISDCEKMKIKGNIYDNPELIKE